MLICSEVAPVKEPHARPPPQGAGPSAVQNVAADHSIKVCCTFPVVGVNYQRKEPPMLATVR